MRHFQLLVTLFYLKKCKICIKRAARVAVSSDTLYYSGVPLIGYFKVDKSQLISRT